MFDNSDNNNNDDGNSNINNNTNPLSGYHATGIILFGFPCLTKERLLVRASYDL